MMHISVHNWFYQLLKVHTSWWLCFCYTCIQQHGIVVRRHLHLHHFHEIVIRFGNCLHFLPFYHSGCHSNPTHAQIQSVSINVTKYVSTTLCMKFDGCFWFWVEDVSNFFYDRKQRINLKIFKGPPCKAVRTSKDNFSIKVLILLNFGWNASYL